MGLGLPDLVTSEPSELSARGGEFEIFLFKNCNIDAFLIEVSMIDVKCIREVKSKKLNKKINWNNNNKTHKQECVRENDLQTNLHKRKSQSINI